jgi:hypothetical protein
MIVSQDKMAIVNYDNLVILRIENTQNGYSIICNSSENVEITLASYNNKDKARNVLKEMFKRYNDGIRTYEIPLN